MYSFFFKYNSFSSKPTQQNLNTNPNDINISSSVKSFDDRTYQLFLERKHPQNFIHKFYFIFNHNFTSPLSFHAHYSLNYHYTTGFVRNYDPIETLLYTLSLK